MAQLNTALDLANEFYKGEVTHLTVKQASWLGSLCSAELFRGPAGGEYRSVSKHMGGYFVIADPTTGVSAFTFSTYPNHAGLLRTAEETFQAIG